MKSRCSSRTQSKLYHIPAANNTKCLHWHHTPLLVSRTTTVLAAFPKFRRMCTHNMGLTPELPRTVGPSIDWLPPIDWLTCAMVPLLCSISITHLTQKLPDIKTPITRWLFIHILPCFTHLRLETIPPPSQMLCQSFPDLETSS